MLVGSDVGLEGATLQTLRASSFAECCAECSKRSDCSGVVEFANGACHLRDGSSSMTVRGGGVRVATKFLSDPVRHPPPPPAAGQASHLYVGSDDGYCGAVSSVSSPLGHLATSEWTVAVYFKYDSDVTQSDLENGNYWFSFGGRPNNPQRYASQGSLQLDKYSQSFGINANYQKGRSTQIQVEAPSAVYAAVLDGQWHHAAFTKSSTGQVSVYIDTALSHTFSLAVDKVSVDSDEELVFTLAGFPASAYGSPARIFRGYLSDLRVYSSSMSPSLFLSSSCTSHASALACLPLNEGFGKLLRDDVASEPLHFSKECSAGTYGWESTLASPAQLLSEPPDHVFDRFASALRGIPNLDATMSATSWSSSAPISVESETACIALCSDSVHVQNCKAFAYSHDTCVFFSWLSSDDPAGSYDTVWMTTGAVWWQKYDDSHIAPPAPPGAPMSVDQCDDYLLVKATPGQGVDVEGPTID